MPPSPHSLAFHRGISRPVIPPPTITYHSHTHHSRLCPVILAPVLSFLRLSCHSCACPVILAPVSSFLRLSCHSCACLVIPAKAGIYHSPSHIRTNTHTTTTQPEPSVENTTAVLLTLLRVYYIIAVAITCKNDELRRPLRPNPPRLRAPVDSSTCPDPLVHPTCGRSHDCGRNTRPRPRVLPIY